MRLTDVFSGGRIVQVRSVVTPKFEYRPSNCSTQLKTRFFVLEPSYESARFASLTHRALVKRTLHVLDLTCLSPMQGARSDV